MNTPSIGHLLDFAGLRVAQLEAADLLVAEDLLHGHVRVDSILGWAIARSTMILLARNVSRRWSRWTFVANRVR